jgi:hypothetical protein
MKNFLIAILFLLCVVQANEIDKLEQIDEVHIMEACYPEIDTMVGQDCVKVVFGRIAKQIYDDTLKTNRIYIEKAKFKYYTNDPHRR